MTDDELLEQLARSLASVNDPSEPDRAAANAAFAMRSLDGSLAQLVHDSSVDTDGYLVRGADDDGRRLSFEEAGIALEVGIEAGRLVGQVLPAQPADVELYRDSELFERMTADDLGLFDTSSALRGRFALIVRTEAGRIIRTPLFTI